MKRADAPCLTRAEVAEATVVTAEAAAGAGPSKAAVGKATAATVPAEAWPLEGKTDILDRLEATEMKVEEMKAVTRWAEVPAIAMVNLVAFAAVAVVVTVAG